MHYDSTNVELLWVQNRTKKATLHDYRQVLECLELPLSARRGKRFRSAIQSLIFGENESSKKVNLNRFKPKNNPLII